MLRQNYWGVQLSIFIVRSVRYAMIALNMLMIVVIKPKAMAITASDETK
jgi:hypothetical protein